MQIGRPEWWQPAYNPEQPNALYLPSPRLAECPTSATRGEVSELLTIYCRAKAMRGHGVMAYGPDLSKWPARIVDAFLILDDEAARLEEAKNNRA